MAEHNVLGRRGEAIAANYLVLNGYKILERNWRYGKAEVDIIAEKDDFLVIVEVKTRTKNLTDIDKFLPKDRRRRLVLAANAYVNLHDLDKEVRFDLIFINRDGSSYTIEHIEQAFLAQW